MRPSLRRRLACERGAINFVTTFAVLAIAATGYLLYSYIPHWMTNREVVAAMREAAYQGWRTRDDDQIRRMIRAKTDRLLYVEDELGREWPVIDEGMIRVDRDDDFIYVDISYEIPMHFPGTQKIRQIHFDNSVKTDLKSPLAD
ncbi:hypothetical protein [Vulgatibacter sp.]|uniref:hypothetical protein n=1 Tax=Vulgatibacter sp. TaxID=1971226 RepID=UPI0035642529